ncbi:MAG TPA: response regulator transcription factor [Terracidiphilus sp.]|jgi:two-component system NarL family response regulator
MDEPSKTIKVLIVDDHPVVRLGLKTMLESEENITVTGTAGSAKEAQLEVARLHPDIVLMDLRMPEVEGAQAIVELRRIYPDIRILVLTNYAEDEYIFQALRAGAMGYLPKSTPQQEIVQAVEMVHKNIRCVPPAIAKRLLEVIGREELSQRELEVLKLVSAGLTNKQIAQRLFIAEKTARNHVASCLEKLNANDRTEAVTTAIRRGLIRVSE